MSGEWDGKDRRQNREEIDGLQLKAASNADRLVEIEKRQVVIGLSIENLVRKVENGLSSTVSDIHSILLKLIPVIDRHTSLEKRIEDIFWWLVKILIAALLGVMVWAVANGWKP